MGEIYGVEIPRKVQKQYEISDNEYNFKGISLLPNAKQIIYVVKNIMKVLKFSQK